MTQERLQQAQQFLKQRKFDQARDILESIADNPTAQKWLAKLDEIAPRPKQPAAPETFVDEPQTVEPEPEPIKQPMPEYLQSLGDYSDNVLTEDAHADEAAHADEIADSADADVAYDGATTATSGQQWEYATLEQNINRLNPNIPMFRLEVFDANGEHQVMAETEFENAGAFNRTFKQLIAELGTEGWQLVHIETDPEVRLHRTYTFKRLI
jgi:hypothetical protein